MTATLKTTTLTGTLAGYGEVIVTKGGVVDGRQIYGVFSGEESARSIDADKLAIAILGESDLTKEQRQDAAANSDSLCD